jgi:L-alanine-DL-glutamate epimerase-like enolase superfamily enzyme
MDVARIESVSASAYKVPTESPESDGTLEWNSTTLVLVEAEAGGKIGIGYSYADASAVTLIESLLTKLVVGTDALSIPTAHAVMVREVRNTGRAGIASTAISAVDNALWDLKAKLVGLPLIDLLGAARPSAEIYGSGGFTSYPDEKLQDQFEGWVSQGIRKVKMKIGRDPVADIKRVQAARKIVGPDVELFVDANGAYSRKQALAQAHQFADLNVRWFEEPVSSDDLEGLRLLRDHGPTGMNIAAGEYGFDSTYFRRMLEAGAVDVLQADATRCCGITGFLAAAELSQAFHVPFSFHCAPALHASVACAVPSFFVGEYFFDHVRIEQMFFDGVPLPQNGKLTPDRSRPGFGLEFKRADAQRFAI